MNVVMGYEPSGGHIFCTVKQETTGRPLYNSMDDDEGGTHQLDVEYYRAILALLGLAVPESMFREVQRDQAYVWDPATSSMTDQQQHQWLL